MSVWVWLWSPLAAVSPSVWFLWILCFQLQLWYGLLLPLSSSRLRLYGQISCLYCLLFPPGTCSMRGLLPILLNWVLGCFFFLSLSLPLYIWQLQIGYGICLRYGLLRRVFRVVFVGRGGSGIHHPSIAASPGCSSVVFLFPGFFAGVLWLFHPWGLHTILLIVLPLALCCPWCWFSLLVHTWFVSWQLDWSLSFFYHSQIFVMDSILV